MRAFFAVELPAETHAIVTRSLGELRRRLPAARWVRPEGVHITVRFLGERAPELLDDLVARARGELRALPPVTVELGDGGFFPNERRPRVAWLGGSAAGLGRWAEAIERSAAAVGIEPEERPFSLHVTLARLERPWGVRDVETFRTVVGKWHLAPFEAREVVLFSSELKPSGAVHTPIARLAVGG